MLSTEAKKRVRAAGREFIWRRRRIWNIELDASRWSGKQQPMERIAAAERGAMRAMLPTERVKLSEECK